MMGSSALPSAVGDDARGDAEAPRAVAFHGKARMIPRAYGGLMTPVQIYSTEGEVFGVTFGDVGAAFEMWTDGRGLDAIIDACMAAKVRATA